MPKLGGAGLWDVGLLLLRASRAFLWTSTCLDSAEIALVYSSFAASLTSSAAGSCGLRRDVSLDLCRRLDLPREWRRLDLLLPMLLQWLCIYQEMLCDNLLHRHVMLLCPGLLLINVAACTGDNADARTAIGFLARPPPGS